MSYSLLSGDILKLEVRDNGKGIDEGFIDSIFNPFTKDGSSGTGLGLAICKKIVNQYEGEISVQSKKGEGSTFVFTLKTV